MPVTAYIQLGIAAIQIIMQIIQDVQGGQAPQVGQSTSTFLTQLGSVGKIKELQGVDLSTVAPAVDGLFSQIHALVHQQQTTTPPAA